VLVLLQSGTDYDNEDYAGELWDELEVVLQVQEDDFVEQDEATATGVPGSLFNVTKQALPLFFLLFFLTKTIRCVTARGILP
jgi:hypothetical protein